MSNSLENETEMQTLKAFAMTVDFKYDEDKLLDEVLAHILTQVMVRVSVLVMCLSMHNDTEKKEVTKIIRKTC